MGFLKLLVIPFLSIALGEIQTTPGSEWVSQLLHHIVQTSAGTTDVVLGETKLDSPNEDIFDNIRTTLDLLALPKHESSISSDVKRNVLYMVDGMNDSIELMIPTECTYYVIVVNSGIPMARREVFQRISCTHLLMVDTSHDPLRVHRVSPADHHSTEIFYENSSLATILDDRNDWRGREVNVMYSPADPPYSVSVDGRLTGLDIELCRSIFDQAGIRYRFVERPPITSPDYGKYQLLVFKFLNDKNIHMMVSSVLFKSPFSTALTVFDKTGFCLIIPKNLQRNVVYHLVHPFKYNVWLLIAAFLALDLILARLFVEAFPHNLIMILLFGDSLADHQQTRCTRYYCFFCAVLLFLLSEAYLAKAIIYMTITRYTPDMQTLDEVFASDVMFKVPPGSTQFFKNQGDIYHRLYQRSIEDPNFRYDMADDRYGYMVSCRYGEYLIERHVRQEILDFGQRGAKRRFYMLDQMVSWEFRRYMVMKHFTFYGRFKRATNWLFEGGLWDKWEAMYRFDYKKDGFDFHMWDEDDILALEDIVAIWYLMATGLVISVMASCGGVARENGTYFVNPNHPDTTDGTGSCQLTVLKMHPDICQIRLDFDQFSINGPEIVNHICNNDQFLVSGGSPAPTICGTSNGDHMYIDAGMGQSNPIILTVITSGPSYPRSWRVRISQIPCGAISKAEQGCLQYFTGVSGRIKSFNFDTISGRQLSNQDYSLCIRTERNFCSIHYTACPDVSRNRSRTFTLSGNSNMAVQAMVGGGTQGAPNSCMHDWLLIPCAKVADRMPTASTCEDKICGGVFNAEISSVERTVVSTVRPFHLAFHTDSVEAPMDVDNRGFCLDYVQQPCTSN
ncbi:hypothetical protein pipiens_013409 [Culex pipiens pipiens]|uniref:CUB domain-containing protein n=1 Tax=Culex pipiens pipiens TaxID=38569 RepID=A0ABD1CZS0_CULPP